jgi:GT2 family glycosyltransferase
LSQNLNYIIVTNTYKRSIDLVTRCIRASLKQKVVPRKVILLDQNIPPINLPPDIAENKLFQKQEIKYHSVSAARNSLIIPEGIEWIFFCDDDAFPDENYSDILQNIIEKNPDIEILAGSIIREDTKTNYTFRQRKWGTLKHFRNTKKLMGSNFVIKVKTFDELERFDENFGVGSYWESGEETDFCWKAYFSGRKIEFFPQLIVYHVPPFHESIKKGFTKSFRYGVGKGALVWKWLIKNRKLKVTYELLEMIIVPPFQMVRGIVTLKPALTITHMASLAGRIYGFIKAAFVK